MITNSKYTYIYGLVDPRDGRVRYVGKANNPRVRLRAHIQYRNNGHNPRKGKWIDALLKIGISPSLVFLERVESHQWQSAEKFQIAFFRERGLADLNIHKGGDGSHSDMYSDDARRRLSENAKRRLLTEPNNPFRRFGRKHSLETLEKLRMINKINANNPERNRKLSEAHKARNFHIPDYQKRKMTEGTKRGWANPVRRLELIESIRKHRTGTHQSEDTKKKISETKKEKYRERKKLWEAGDGSIGINGCCCMGRRGTRCAQQWIIEISGKRYCYYHNPNKEKND